MDVISISQLKTNPSSVILKAGDYPVAVANRNKVKAYLVSKQLYDKLISYIENYIDAKAVESTDFSKGKDFVKVAKTLGL